MHNIYLGFQLAPIGLLTARSLVKADKTNSTASNPIFPPISSSLVGSLQSVEQAFKNKPADAGTPKAASRVVKESLSDTFTSTSPKM